MNEDRCIEELGEFIEKSVTPFHTVLNVGKYLAENNFIELKKNEEFNIVPGGAYFVNIFDSSMIAFTIGENAKCAEDRMRLRCSSSHTDFPCFKIKPNYLFTENVGTKKGYIKVNTETYGGAILNTWLDRPLSMAGKVVIRGKNWLDNKTFFVNVNRPVLTIPNLAIHINREVNMGTELNKQKDMIPIAAFMSDEIEYEEFVEKLIISELSKQGLNFEINDILDFEMYIYQFEKGCKVGLNEEMYSSPRLDNLTSVFAQMKSIANVRRKTGINMAMFYDNEEIGSKTKQGAESQMVMLILEKIYNALGYSRNDMIDDILSGMMISIDVAHALHPNSPEKSDSINKVMLNEGIVIKQAASQSYANDAEGIGIVKSICENVKEKCQIFVNRSDMPGGQTLGSISSTVMPMRTIDIGVPILAMHSARELMGCKDQKSLEKFLTGFYS